MCCFSRPVKHVSGTNILARYLDRDAQALVYSMNVELDEEAAMVLPLPVPPGPAEDAVRFVDLSRYETLFHDLRQAFPGDITRGAGTALAFAPQPASPRLVVHAVGSFDASFVPTRGDFARLDPRFRLPESTFEALPAYADWGFCVFKLRPRQQTVHPMAFVFPRRDPGHLFFPTVHVHDGQVHERASFDHALYVQIPMQVDGRPWTRGNGWTRSDGPLGRHVDTTKTEGLVDGAWPGYRRHLAGMLPNQDTWLQL